MIKAVLMFGALGVALPVAAQDLDSQEVVVTASRVEQDSYERDMPAVGLRRTADFLVQEVVIRGDTRDPKQRADNVDSALQHAG